MDLIDAIKQHASQEAAAGNWSAVASIVSELTFEQRDSTPLTYARIRAVCGEHVRQVVAATLRSVAKSDSPLAGEIEDAHRVMLDESVGLRIDYEDRQEVIRTLGAAAGWSSELVNKIASLGVREVKTVGTVTSDECQAAWESEAEAQIAETTRTRKAVLESAIRRLPDAIDTIVGTDGVPSRADVLQRIGEVLDSFPVTFGD